MGRMIRRILKLFIIIIAVLIVILIIFRIKYHNAIVGLARTHVMNITSDLINDAVDVQITIGNIQYERIVYFEKDLDGRITALKTNMSEVNRLKTDILSLINDEILAMDSATLGIPVGNLIFPELLSGRGAVIPIKIIAIRNSDGSFESDFVEAGINQTLHKLSMDIIVDVSVLVWGKVESFTVSSQVVVAETVIVGQVPNTYLETGE